MIPDVRLFMTLENRSGRIGGKRQSWQGFAVSGEFGFALHHTGICSVYDLAAQSSEPLAVFPLGSYNTGFPDGRYTNHANDAMFGAAHYGDNPLPLLYVTAGNSGECDEDGYIGRCAVENIVRGADGWFAETVQTILYQPTENEVGWGWPAQLPDPADNAFWLFSARHRTKNDPQFLALGENAYILTRFELPPVRQKGEKVILREKDVTCRFECPFDVFFTQGGTVADGILYYTFGCGNEKHPNALRAYDLRSRRCLGGVDFSASVFASEELECAAPYHGKLLLNTQAGRLYEMPVPAF